MSGDEKIVRDSWIRVRLCSPRDSRFGYISADGLNLSEYLPNDEAWSAAARYTEERLRKIAENEEEIKLMSDDSLWLYTGGRDVIIGRILTHLQAIHADLKRGLR